MAQILTIGISAALLALTACSDPGGGTRIDGTTKFKSTTLESSSNVTSLKRSALVVSEGDITLTPTNVSGQALSLLYGFGSGQGLDIFGPVQPDIAQPGAELVTFNFADELAIESTVYLKDDFPGGESITLVIGFGYLDISFTLDGQNLSTDNHSFRVAMGSVEGMTRGDVMMKMDGEYKWFDLTNEVFTTTRPDNPVVIDEIKNFYDSDTPDRHFYFFNVGLSDGGISVNVQELLSSAGIYNEVDFSIGSIVEIDECTDSDTLHDEDLIQKFSIDSILVEQGISDEISATSVFQLL